MICQYFIYQSLAQYTLAAGQNIYNLCLKMCNYILFEDFV